jgi:hypothetical protein
MHLKKYKDAQYMEKKETVSMKLELCKPSTGETLTITAHLNPHAPNIKTFEDHISWTFTKEEQEFLFDALQLIRSRRTTPTNTQHQIIRNTTNTNDIDTQINETIQKHSPTIQTQPFVNKTIDAIIKDKQHQG